MSGEDRRQQKWVELRAACTVQGTFDQIAEVIERDVDRFNKLSADVRRDRTFKCERREWAAITIAELTNHGAWIGAGIRVSASHTKITVWLDSKMLFEIQHEWNEETLTCDLKINDKCYSIWQISQKVLGDFLFGYD